MNVSGPSGRNFNPFRTPDDKPTSDTPITGMGKASGDYGKMGNFFFRKVYDSVTNFFTGKYWQGGWFAPKKSGDDAARPTAFTVADASQVILRPTHALSESRNWIDRFIHSSGLPAPDTENYSAASQDRTAEEFRTATGAAKRLSTTPAPSSTSNVASQQADSESEVNSGKASRRASLGSINTELSVTAAESSLNQQADVNLGRFSERRDSTAGSFSGRGEGEDLAGDIAGGPWDLPGWDSASIVASSVSGHGEGEDLAGDLAVSLGVTKSQTSSTPGGRPVSLLKQAFEEQAAKDEKYQKNLQTFDKISTASEQVAPRELTSKATAKDDIKVSYEGTFSVRFTKEEQDAAFNLFKTASKTLKENPRVSELQLSSDSGGVRSLARSQNVKYASALQQYNEALAGLDKVGLSFNSQTGKVSKKN